MHPDADVEFSNAVGLLSLCGVCAKLSCKYLSTLSFKTSKNAFKCSEMQSYSPSALES